MPIAAEEEISLRFLWIGTAAAWVCFGVWLAILSRAWQGRNVLPREQPRWVPWRGRHLCAVFGVYFLALVAAHPVISLVLDPAALQPPDIYKVGEASKEHAATRILTQGEPWAVVVCGLAAAVGAPIVEEFLFRVLLQGWLESAKRRWRRRMPTLRRLVPGAIGPIVLASFVFGWLHFRVEAPPRPVAYYVAALLGTLSAGAVTAAFALALLRFRAGATAADFGWVPGHFLADVRLGLLSFLAVGVPIYSLQIALTALLPSYLAPDPFTLFVLALVLGTLYHRTHRIVPPIVLHMALNTTSLALEWLRLAK
jgi:membrane protease YdiL (CAAX protease family)